MPVIVYKTMTVDLTYAYGRRINCEHCEEPFTYLHHDNQSAQVTGLPLINSDDKMRENAVKQAMKSLAKIADKKRIGQATCPHCRKYQQWMIRSAQTTGLGCGFLAGIALGLALCFFIRWLAGWENVLYSVFIPTAIISVISAFVCMFCNINPDEYLKDESKKDPRSMTDEDLDEYLAKCDAEDYDPAKFWYLMLGNQPGERALLSLGFDDLTGEDFFPEEYTTSHMLDQMQT